MTASSLWPMGEDLADELLGSILFRIREEQGGLSHLEYLALFHENDPVSNFSSESHLVRHHKHGHTIAREVTHHVEHFLDHLRVEDGRRLVEQHDLGLHAQRSGYRGSLLLPAGERIWVSVSFVRDAHTIQEPSCKCDCVLTREPSHLQGGENEILQNGNVRE